jgi:hypothetical protein
MPRHGIRSFSVSKGIKYESVDAKKGNVQFSILSAWSSNRASVIEGAS